MKREGVFVVLDTIVSVISRFISLDFCKNSRFISLDFCIFQLFICLDNFDLLFLHTETKRIFYMYIQK